MFQRSKVNNNLLVKNDLQARILCRQLLGMHDLNLSPYLQAWRFATGLGVL